MKKILIIFLTWFVELFAYIRWFHCWLFRDMFYFTPQTLIAQLIDATNADRGMPLFIVRAIHNKVLALGWGLLQTLLQYWDIRFLEEFISIIGAIGVGFALWYLCTRDRKNILVWGTFATGIIFSLIEMFFQPNIPYAWVLYGFGFVFQVLSLYGMWNLLKKDTKVRYGVVFLLLLISFFAVLLFPLSYQVFCLKI